MHKHVNKKCKLIVSFVFFAAQLSRADRETFLRLPLPLPTSLILSLSSPSLSSLITLKCFCYCFGYSFFFCGSTMWLNTHLVSASEMASICTLSCFCPRRGGERGVVVAGHWYWPSNATKEIQKSSKINKQTKCLQSFHLLTYHFVLLIVVVVVSIAISCYCCCCCYSWWCRCR